MDVDDVEMWVVWWMREKGEAERENPVAADLSERTLQKTSNIYL